MEAQYKKEKKDSLKFYQGNTRIEQSEEKLKEFYKTPEAYQMINALMFRGIENEETRINENRCLNGDLLFHIEEIINIYSNIFSLMKECSKNRSIWNQRSLITYRTERGQAMEELKKRKCTVSLTSTSKIETPQEYFQTKAGLTLLQFKISSNVPFVDVNEVLGKESLFPDQQEILLPPFLKLEISEKELTEKEKGYRDFDGNPPLDKYEVCVFNEIVETDLERLDEHTAYSYLVNVNNIKNAVEVIKGMNQGCLPNNAKLKKYMRWKEYFQVLMRLYLKKLF